MGIILTPNEAILIINIPRKGNELHKVKQFSLKSQHELPASVRPNRRKMIALSGFKFHNGVGVTSYVQCASGYHKRGQIYSNNEKSRISSLGLHSDSQHQYSPLIICHDGAHGVSYPLCSQFSHTFSLCCELFAQ